MTLPKRPPCPNGILGGCPFGLLRVAQSASYKGIPIRESNEGILSVM
jgi:hypothetical protein